MYLIDELKFRMNIEILIFELLQVAIGNRLSLSIIPNEEQWKELFALAKKQALVGICYAGILKLPKEQMPSQMFLLKWVGLATKIKEKNNYLNQKCKEVCSHFTQDGFSCCILKGQGNLCNYPEDLRMFRNPGDIDVWVWTPSIPLKGGGSNEFSIPSANLDEKGVYHKNYTSKSAVIRYVLLNTPEAQRKAVVNDMRQHHIDYYYYKDTTVEVHFTPSYFQSPLKNGRLQRWFEEHEEDCHVSSLGFKMGSAGFNTVYQIVHVYKHLFNEGIGLRQLLDYYFVLRALHIEQGDFSDRTQSMAQWAEGMDLKVSSNKEIMHTLSRFGMKRFASGVMWVLAYVFDNGQRTTDNGQLATSQQVEIEHMVRPWMICEPNEKEGMFLLNEIMLAGNFGKYDERNRKMQRASKLKRFWLLTKRNWRFFKHYPSEVFWDPFRRTYNVIWRKLKLWRY